MTQYINLLSLELPTYRPYCDFTRKMRRQKQERQGERTKDPFLQAYNQVMNKWEGVAQHLLSTNVQECRERILTYWSNINNRHRKEYCEIDFVEGTNRAPLTFVEIKVRERSTIKQDSGWKQLNKSLKIARAKWPKLNGLSVNVAIGDIVGTDPEPGCDLYELRWLPKIFSELRIVTAQPEKTTIWLRGRDLADYGIEHGLLTEDEIAQLPTLHAEMLNPLQILDQKKHNAITLHEDQYRNYSSD